MVEDAEQQLEFLNEIQQSIGKSSVSYIDIALLPSKLSVKFLKVALIFKPIDLILS